MGPHPTRRSAPTGRDTPMQVYSATVNVHGGDQQPVGVAAEDEDTARDLAVNEVGGDAQVADIEAIPTEDDALPPSVRPGSRTDDAWYEYDGEMLFSAEGVRILWDRYQEMDETEWERVSTTRSGTTTRLKVRTKDVEDLEADLDDRYDEVNEEFDFIIGLESGLLGNHHGIHEEGPRKSVAWADYQAGGPAMLGGAKYKREQLLKPVRNYEQWVYHNRVWLPVVEPYHEDYPY